MIRAIRRSVYLLQLENYELGRYLKVVWTTPFIRTKYRQKIVWTPKLIGVFTLAFILQILVSYLAVRWVTNDEVYLGLFPLAFLFTFLFLSFFHFIFLCASVLILKPADMAVKAYIVSKAKSKIMQWSAQGRSATGGKIIGITGSYGKTTMKEVLATILTEKFKILKTPESVNTPVGISRLIMRDLYPDTEVFIVEMGAYGRGDIKALCDIAKPQIAVLTGINEQHLERFGTIENTIMTKFEIVENTAKDSLVLLNGDDERVKQNYEKFIGNRRAEFYTSARTQYQDMETALLGEYIWGVINACGIIAKELGMTQEEIRRALTSLRPIPHRLQKIENPNGITVIDDSYNGNPDGVKEAIKVLAKFATRRKIYITPGLVEIGVEARRIHNDIGAQLNNVADQVILIKNSVTPFIAEKLDQNKILWFASTEEAHKSLEGILKPGDVIMFQNDWPDNYK